MSVLKEWEALPAALRLPQVRPYYDALRKKRGALVCKRILDVALAALLLVPLLPVFALLAAAIRLDSPGPVFYRQVRVTQYGREFRIHKFRSMVADAERIGTQVTVSGDSRVTRVGRVIRACRLDEIGQLLDVLAGHMTFVGTRPEVPKYVAQYTPEMMATLLLPAGITSLASIRYKDEAALLDRAEDADQVYVTQILPEKMRYNLAQLENFSLRAEAAILWKTVGAVLKKDG